MVIKLEIQGEPMGKQRPKIVAFGNTKYPHAYTPKETVQYESHVVFNAKQELERMGFDKNVVPFCHDEEIWATIVAYYPITKAHYKYHKKTNTTDLDREGVLMLDGKKNPTKKPDCDNIAKIILDALNGILYPDDSQITMLLVSKRYSENPRVEVTLENAK